VHALLLIWKAGSWDLSNKQIYSPDSRDKLSDICSLLWHRASGWLLLASAMYRGPLLMPLTKKGDPIRFPSILFQMSVRFQHISTKGLKLQRLMAQSTNPLKSAAYSGGQ
jgi:hypothetical protein